MLENSMKSITQPDEDLNTIFSDSKTEKIQLLVNILVKNCQKVSLKKKNRKAKSTLPERDFMGSDLKQYKSWLSDAHQTFRGTSEQMIPLTFASEWVLDNYYIIRQALQQIKEDLPNSFYKQLPKLIEVPHKDLPRIYVIAQSILAIQSNSIDPVDLQTILVQFQESVPLTMGELWALPIFLRYSLIESLSNELIRIIQPLNPPDIPLPFSHLAGLPIPNPASGSASGGTNNSNGIANIILSLRTISEQNWSEFFESVSSLEQTLRKDPAGIYSQMDFNTRDLYRKEIEVLAMATGRGENELAELTLNLARTAGTSQFPYLQNIANSDSSVYTDNPLLPGSLPDIDENLKNGVLNQHIGEYLLGQGRMILEQQIGYRPNLKKTYKRWVLQNASAFYLSIILILTILIFVLLSLVIRPAELLSSISQFPGNSPWGLTQISGNLAIRWITIIVMSFNDVDSYIVGYHQPDKLVDNPDDSATHSTKA